MLIAGLTGGIASGKSTVSGMFQNAGAMIIDADVMARRVVEPGLPAWQAIKSMFGDQVVRPDGTLDRPLLGDLVFNDGELRERLEGIIHPQVRDLMDREVARLMRTYPNALVIKDIPLLIEAGMTSGLAEIVVVYVPVDLQIKRLMKRDGIGLAAAKARIQAQMPIEEKRRLGTLVIDNSCDLSHTEAQVLEIYADLSKRARNNR